MGTFFILSAQERSLCKSHLSCKLGERKKLSPKGKEGRAVSTEGTARVSGLGGGEIWETKETLRK